MRGWRKERVLWTADTAGRPVAVTTGLTVDRHGDDVGGLAINALGQVSEVGPSAVLMLDSGAELVSNLRLSLTDLLDLRGGA
ncbi:hypothetical protein [Amycolatopsis benzoatilytica]|uniref:hypothetical protein n=1 Tax=Amycolatopsis benzoatilytica TaxID=346045 RepID=UPI000A011654|nr:hypothetical protein [Amycolatopsis benzoatilytica]